MLLRVSILAAGAALALATAASAQTSGQDLFVQNCSACHQPTGQGIPGAFPALAGNTYVQGPIEPVVKTVLNGRAGMPSFSGELSDAQLSAILSYVRSAWGNAAPPVDAATVAAGRTGGITSDAGKSVLSTH